MTVDQRNMLDKLKATQVRLKSFISLKKKMAELRARAEKIELDPTAVHEKNNYLNKAKLERNGLNEYDLTIWDKENKIINHSKENSEHEAIDKLISFTTDVELVMTNNGFAFTIKGENLDLYSKISKEFDQDPKLKEFENKAKAFIDDESQDNIWKSLYIIQQFKNLH